MYAITYQLFTGTGFHRAPPAKSAIEMTELLATSGARVVKIVIARSGKELSVAELRLLAEDER